MKWGDDYNKALTEATEILHFNTGLDWSDPLMLKLIDIRTFLENMEGLIDRSNVICRKE
jgi:hypothetical protein